MEKDTEEEAWGAGPAALNRVGREGPAEVEQSSWRGPDGVSWVGVWGKRSSSQSIKGWGGSSCGMVPGSTGELRAEGGDEARGVGGPCEWRPLDGFEQKSDISEKNLTSI